MVMTGFSAGAGLALPSLLWIHDQPDADVTGLNYSIRGIVAIYPGIDARHTRTSSASGLTNFLYSVWDAAYVSQAPKQSPFVSPAAADDNLLSTALPARIGLYPVGLDPYATPTESFRQRLQSLGKNVRGHVEPDQVHAWDKYPIQSDDPQWQRREKWFAEIAADVEDMLRM